MAKGDLEAKTIAQLRQMAAKKGIAAARGWKKKDFIKALSSKKKSTVKAAKPAKRPKTVRKVAARKPPAVKQNKRIVLPALPQEYCEDKIVSIPVSPARLYVYWEVPENKIAGFRGSLNLKIHDAKTNSFFYTPVSGRVGESFISVNPGSACSVELGVIDFRGEFVNIVKVKKRSNSRNPDVPARAPESSEPPRELPDEFFEIPDSVSSY